jgi:hypothetical protein
MRGCSLHYGLTALCRLSFPGWRVPISLAKRFMKFKARSLARPGPPWMNRVSRPDFSSERQSCANCRLRTIQLLCTAATLGRVLIKHSDLSSAFEGKPDILYSFRAFPLLTHFGFVASGQIGSAIVRNTYRTGQRIAGRARLSAALIATLKAGDTSIWEKTTWQGDC